MNTDEQKCVICRIFFRVETFLSSDSLEINLRTDPYHQGSYLALRALGSLARPVFPTDQAAMHAARGRARTGSPGHPAWPQALAANSLGPPCFASPLACHWSRRVADPRSLRCSAR